VRSLSDAEVMIIAGMREPATSRVNQFLNQREGSDAEDENEIGYTGKEDGF